MTPDPLHNSSLCLHPLRIFLSYGHDANEELVRRIKADLEARGHDVWFDKAEIKAGDDWRRAILDGIDRSNQVLSFLSKHSTRDPGVCLDEIAIAIGVKGGNIQTVLVESEQDVKPPASISHIQWLDMHDWKERKERASGIPPEHPDSWESWYKKNLAQIVRVVESDASLRFAGEIETLSGHLKPISGESRISLLLGKGFVGREWLFKAVEAWRNPGNADPQADSSDFILHNSSFNLSFPSRLFWITGDPGVGKSAFAAHLTHFGRDRVIAAQFVEWDKPDHRDAARVIRSLAFQLATRLPDYRKRLLTLPEIAELDRKNPAELFDYVLATPLKGVIDGGRERYLIVIDALDEANENGRNPLVEMLARHAPRLPDWLGLVVTSRPESAVTGPFQGLNPLVLDTRTEANRDDLRRYLCQTLAPQLTGRADADRIVERILDKSEGVFLYAEHVCAALAPGGNLSLDHLDQFPQGLGGIYHEFFTRQFPDEGQFEKTVEPMLGAILAAREPLPVDILQKLFNWRETELRKWLRTLGSLFPVTKTADTETIKPCHKSVRDWLTDATKAGGYFVSEKEGHRLLGEQGFQEFVTGIDGMSHYHVGHVAYHLSSSKNWVSLQEIMLNKQMPFLPAWRELNSFPAGWDNLPFLNRVLNTVRVTRERRSGGIPDDYEELYKLFHALHQCASSRTAFLFFKAIEADLHLPGVFRSSFSDWHCAMHLNLTKIYIYESVKGAISKLIEQGVTIPGSIITYRKDLQTACLYCESEYLLRDADLINEIARNRGFIFRGDIDEKDTLFNTFSLVIELLAKEPNSEQIQKLIHFGANLSHQLDDKSLSDHIESLAMTKNSIPRNLIP